MQNLVTYNVGINGVPVVLVYRYDQDQSVAEWYITIGDADFYWVLSPEGTMTRRHRTVIGKRDVSHTDRSSVRSHIEGG